MLNRTARVLGVTLADFVAPLDVVYRVRFRKPGRDLHRRSKQAPTRFRQDVLTRRDPCADASFSLIVFRGER
jgi:hypothetical protein